MPRSDKIIDITPDPHPESLTLDKLKRAVQLIHDMEDGITDDDRLRTSKLIVEQKEISDGKKR